MASIEDKIKQLQAMGFDVDVQLLEAVLQANQGDVDKALDELLTMNAADVLNGSVQPPDVLRGSVVPAKPQEKTEVVQPVTAPSTAPDQLTNVHNEEIQQLKALALENLVQHNAAQKAQDSGEVGGSQVIRVAEEDDVDTVLNMNVLLGVDNTWPQFTIYRRSDMITTAQINEITSIQKLLVELGATERREVDLSYDYELQAFLKTKCAEKKVEYKLPLVFFRDTPIGNLARLKQLAETGELKKMIEYHNKTHAEQTAKAAAPSPSPIELAIAAAAAAAGLKEAPTATTPPTTTAAATSASPTTNAAPVTSSTQIDLQLNFFDKCLNTVESVASWFNPWSWFGKPGQRVAQPQSNDYKEFDVVQSNWYWRHQHRKLRFASDFFVRIHPTLHEVRALHKIEDVAKITLVNATNFIIHYKDRSSPDFIRASEADVTEMSQIIANHPKRDPNFVIEKLGGK